MTHAVSEELGKLVVKLTGEVDLEHSPEVRKLLLECVRREMDVVIDLSGVDYIDSSGVASLVEALQTANNQGTGFELAAVAGQVRRVLELARLDKVFKIHQDVAGAVALVRREA